MGLRMGLHHYSPTLAAGADLALPWPPLWCRLADKRQRGNVATWQRGYGVFAAPKGSGDCAASQAAAAQQATFCAISAGTMRSSVSFTVWCTSK